MLRVAVFPPDDLTGKGPPLARLRDLSTLAMARVGADVVSGPPVDEFLARHRIRHTGALDAAGAAAAREELGVDAVLVTTIVTWVAVKPPSVALSMRLVSTDAEPTILWMDGVAATGADDVGFLGLGAVDDAEALAASLLQDDLTASLRRFADGRAPAPAAGCPPAARFEPQAVFRAPGAPRGLGGLRIAVLPFRNRTTSAASGQAVMLDLLRVLTSVPGVRLIEHGVVRRELLRFRMVMSEGVTLDAVDMLLGSLDADLVVAGTADEWREVAGAAATVGFSVVVVDAKSRRIVWRFRSHHRGDEGVRLFGTGIIRSAASLSCGMTARLAQEIASATR